MITKVVIRITVNDEGYIEKDVQIDTISKHTSEQIANLVSEIIDDAFADFVKQHNGRIEIIDSD